MHLFRSARESHVQCINEILKCLILNALIHSCTRLYHTVLLDLCVDHLLQRFHFDWSVFCLHSYHANHNLLFFLHNLQRFAFLPCHPANLSQLFPHINLSISVHNQAKLFKPITTAVKETQVPTQKDQIAILSKRGLPLNHLHMNKLLNFTLIMKLIK